MNKKSCSRCQLIKELSEFGRLKKTKDGYNHICKICKRIYDNTYHENRDITKKTYKNTKQKERILKIKTEIKIYLSDKKCKKCGEKRIPTLDFHHISDKSFNISDGIKNGYSLNKIQKEIEKCEILCSNCHRMETFKTFGWFAI